MSLSTKLIILLTVLSLGFSLKAQQPVPQTSADSSLLIWEKDQDYLDSLIDEFYVSKYLKFFDKKTSFKANTPQKEALNLPDSVYIKRLQALPFAENLTYNPKVKSYIDVYVNKRPKQLEVMLALSQYYFPIFEENFEKIGVPSDLKYLAVIESALNPYAVSRVGASGLWQFMYRTGKMYNLIIDDKIDERFDPDKASKAAATYLNDLYRIFDDWTLAIAAYNCGPGNVHKAIKRAKGKNDFWQIYNYLPAETRGYVPAFIGATYAFNYYQEHGIVFPQDFAAFITDTIILAQEVHFSQVAKSIGIPEKVLQDLNPQYKNNIIPANNNQYALKLPINYVTKFLSKKDSILRKNTVDSSLFATKNTASSKPATITYRIKKGENLNIIARKFETTVSEIKQWNNLKSDLVQVNQLITIYTKKTNIREINKVEQKNAIADNKATTNSADSSNNTAQQKAATPTTKTASASSKTSTANNKPAEEKTKPINNNNNITTNKNTANNNNSSKKNTTQKQKSKIIYYKVKRGDTLYSICRNNSANMQEIIKMNNLSHKGNKIFVNQILKLKVN